MDLEMPTGSYYDALYDYIYVSQNLSESYLNRAVGHILAKYDEFGLLGTTTQGSSPLPQDVVEDHAQISYDIAVKSGILLKNDNDSLPLKAGASVAVIGPNGVQYTHGTNFAERAYGIPERQVSTLEALKSRLGEDVASAVGVDQEGSIIPSTHLRNLQGDAGPSRNDTLGGSSNDEVVYFTGTSALPKNASYTWQGQVHADTEGYYTFSFARAIPKWQNHSNPDYGAIFAIGTFSVNGSEVGEGYRLYGDGGVKPWSNSIATRDNWDNIKSYGYLEEGWHDLEASPRRPAATRTPEPISACSAEYANTSVGVPKRCSDTPLKSTSVSKLSMGMEISAGPKYESKVSTVVCLTMPLLVTPLGLMAEPSEPDTFKHVTLAVGATQLA
ncbi:hypothetical protein PF008_g26843 [Phytophthora fragariae]|uniref:beta-glucosidase n=1 Tax=Phytophthora fragariae TaxID=53985 RepID=A0A6G0QGH2_9STRA|nr:hypothetical protein PF008_g26843 [Phytophthora fragariae]